ncbi:MAG: DNA mismatch repair protein MutS [Deltaproteobacteria bacterium]
MAELTPMMQQYLEIKKKHNDCILFFRLGDFYEMFFDDAQLASKELDITLTGRDCGQEERAPMCGVPYHSADSYIAKLISKGYKVAICEQVEDPSEAKGIVRREVIRIVTPGTVTEANMLDESKNNYICSIYKNGINYGLAAADITTGDFFAVQFIEGSSFNQLLNEIAKYMPSEIIMNDEMDANTAGKAQISSRIDVVLWAFNDEAFKYEQSTEIIGSSFEEIGMNNEEIRDKHFAVCAIGGLLNYIQNTQKVAPTHINNIDFYSVDNYMSIDLFSRRNLEISETLRERSKKGTLLWVLDKTNTPMGARMLRKWLEQPLLNTDSIEARLKAVKNLKDDIITRSELIDSLKKIYDIERLLSRIIYGSANARDLAALKMSLGKLPEIKAALLKCSAPLLVSLYENLDLVEDVKNLIEIAIVDEPPFSVREGGLIKEGYNQEVDEIREARSKGRSWLAELESQEREATGIKNLKIGYNKVFGYFIEVTKSYFNLVPDRYIRKQTLANCERYITSELKEMEEKILGAEEKGVELEYRLFAEVRDYIAERTIRLQNSAKITAVIDVLASLALVAEINGYAMPIVDDRGILEIRGGRHPVVEVMAGEGFVPNDTYLDDNENRVAVITGPNMAGKSTYMRQTALIVLMAQIGSFVPAASARIGIVDRIFTRIGASDDLGMGQSTFMVEMTEVANILKNATKKSLLILDEIGRGTSTYDGLSIAWAVTEYVSDVNKIGARTLFATHYHELTELEEKITGVKNYCITVKEKGDDIIFLRKIVRGGADDSYGIQVAKLAGVPYSVINRAKEILQELEDADIIKKQKKESKKSDKMVQGQIDLFSYKAGEIAEEIRNTDIMAMTPIDALNYLYRLKSKIEKS